MPDPTPTYAPLDYAEMYQRSIERGINLALDVIRRGAEGDPVAMLDAAADFLNAHDAVEPGDQALYEKAEAALARLMASASMYEAR